MKRGKKTILPTRRRAALRRLLRGLIVLVLANHFFSVGLLLPIQAIHKAVERGGAVGTRVIAREWTPELYATHLLYLTGSETATVLADTHLGILGWESGFECTLDCTSGAPLYAGERSMSRDGREDSLLYYFGRVDDPDIAAVAVSIQAETYIDGRPVRREVRRLEVPELLERKGYRYFLVSALEPEWEREDAVLKTVAVALDGNGREVGAWDIHNASYSHYG